MNTIFRPNNSFPVKAEDNLLEINVTVETLQFMQSSILKDVPNRGFDKQDDINLTGVPYQQTISDRLNEKTGTIDPKQNVAIHFEQGLFMRVPASTSPSTGGKNSISRMGSIPHGSTINAQAFEPSTSMPERPVIPVIDISPFTIDPPNSKISFASMTTLANVNPLNAVEKGPGPKKVRLPDSLVPFNATGDITLVSLKNPNKHLNDLNEGKKFDSHFEFTVKTKNPELAGGGVSNIAFLMDGKKTESSTNGNAKATQMECTYWVSTLNHEVTIPKGDYTTTQGLRVLPVGDVAGKPGPQFWIQIGRELKVGGTIKVQSTQIQYSQNVTLDFGTLSWPHISVATLAPALPIFIPPTYKPLADLQ